MRHTLIFAALALSVLAAPLPVEQARVVAIEQRSVGKYGEAVTVIHREAEAEADDILQPIETGDIPVRLHGDGEAGADANPQPGGREAKADGNPQQNQARDGNMKLRKGPHPSKTSPSEAKADGNPQQSEARGLLQEIKERIRPDPSKAREPEAYTLHPSLV